ncbi:peptidoglycan DD-metalloendopeptidase family protein [Mycoplasma sp. P36-A1]|uniref:peptidoglycan DD-metalloendopeptidase family protein n=1 Tax=Mycoplasma sp. P36-A1 TaxID=3252900 RepID=UPI003C2DABE9
MNKKIIAFTSFIALSIMNLNNLNAKVDYSNDYNNYSELCSTKSSYALNTTTCDEFVQYQENKLGINITSVDSANKNEVSAKNLNKFNINIKKVISKLNDTVKENKNEQKSNQSKISNLKKEIENNTNNFFSNIFNSSETNKNSLEVTNLSESIKDLNSSNKEIKTQISSLNKTIKTHSMVATEVERSTINLYSSTNSGGTGDYNKALDKVDLSSVEDKNSNWLRPVKHATISAVAWYYPASFGGGWHPGVDFAVNTNTKLIAPADGVILSESKGANGYGNHIVIAVKKGNYVYTMLFAHLNKFKSNVTTFKQGDVIGYTGNTGNSTGPHLHMEIFRHNTSSLKKVVNEFKENEDYWFGLGYTKKGKADKVKRIAPNDFYNLKLNQKY